VSARPQRRTNAGATRSGGRDAMPPGGRPQALDAFLAGAPEPQRSALRALVTLGRRPRGRRLLARLAPADQLAHALVAMDHYDEAAVSRALGWDAAAVAARGRELRRAEGRP
jgi:hypothetical protein